LSETNDDNPINGITQRIQGYREQLEQAPGTWPAKRELASAIRELMECLCATDAPEAELLSIAEQVRASARRFTDQPRMQDLPGVAEGSLAAGMEKFMDRSPLVGLSNPVAPPLKLDTDHEAKVVNGEVTFGNAYEGAPGCAHGGYVAAVFDEALGMACVFSGHPGMTGELTVRYLKPTPTHVPLRLEARMDRREGRKIYNSGELYAGDVLLARSSGIFITIAREKFSELRVAQQERQKGE
jgi:acyl-coenzyme A thioesterase PaaI-like protein